MQFAPRSINLKWFTEHDDFKTLFASFKGRRFIEDISSRERMPQMKTLKTLFPCLKQLAILIRPFRISSSESWYKLLVQDNIITFIKDEKQCKSCVRHSACCSLSPPIPKLKALRRSKSYFRLCYNGTSQW